LNIDDIPLQQIETKSLLPNFTFPTNLLPIDPPKTFYALRTFEEALPIFKKGKKAAESSLKHYVLDGYVTEHIANLECISQLYKLIAFFEPDIPRKW
jgi:hypothetical protein